MCEEHTNSGVREWAEAVKVVCTNCLNAKLKYIYIWKINLYVR